MTTTYGIQYYDAEAHDYIWLGHCDHRTGLPERTWDTATAAQAVIDNALYPQVRDTELIRSDFCVVPVPA